jgi:hypothetical protein
MVPQFTRPENPVVFANPGELIRFFLDRHLVDYRMWDEGKFAEFWEEYAGSDMLITVEQMPGTDKVAVFRNIRTVTLRITYEQHDPTARNPTVLVLVEYRVGKNGKLQPRKHPHSSVTEKMLWNEPGNEEKPIIAIGRVFKEELGINLPYGLLDFDTNFFRVPVDFHRRMTNLVPKNDKQLLLDLSDMYKHEIAQHLERGIDLDVRWSGEDKYPGIVTRNQLLHYWLKLPPELYIAEGYEESTGKYKSFWEPASPAT